MAITRWSSSNFNSPAWLSARWSMGDRVYATQGRSFIERLQTVLRQWDDGVVVDGVWGNRTTDALASFVQGLYGISLADATRIVSSIKRTRVITPEVLKLAIHVAYMDEASQLPYKQRPPLELPADLVVPVYGVAPPQDGMLAASQPRPWSARIGTETVVPIDPDQEAARNAVATPTPSPESSIVDPSSPAETPIPAGALGRAPTAQSKVPMWAWGVGAGVLALGVTTAVLWKMRKE